MITVIPQFLSYTRLAREGRLRLVRTFLLSLNKITEEFLENFQRWECYLLWETLRSLEKISFLVPFKCPLHLVLCGHQSASQSQNNKTRKGPCPQNSHSNEKTFGFFWLTFCFLFKKKNTHRIPNKCYKHDIRSKEIVGLGEAALSRGVREGPSEAVTSESRGTSHTKHQGDSYTSIY